jgi:hypothetical protein
MNHLFFQFNKTSVTMKSLQVIPFILFAVGTAFGHASATTPTEPIALEMSKGPGAPCITTDAILEDLLQMGILKTRKNASFLLEKDRLIVNDEWQSTEVLKQFVKKYKIDKASSWIVYNYSM